MHPEISKKIIDLAMACGLTDDYQHELILDESRSIIIDKARGMGITSALSFQKLMKITIPEVWHNPQKENVIISASDDQADHIIEYVNQYWDIIGGQFSQKVQQGKSKVYSKWGWVMSIACNPRSLRSWHGDLMFDEFAYFANELDYAFFKAQSGAMTTGGQKHFVSNPNGERGKFFEIWDDKKRYKNYKRYSLPYTKCKRELYRNSVKEAKQELLEWEFDEEYRGLFNPPSRGALPNELLDRQTKDYTVNEHKKIEGQLFQGTDFGKVVDETATIILEKFDDKRLRIYWIETMNDDYSFQLQYLKNLDDKLSPSKNLVDKTGVGVKLVEDCQSTIGYKVEGFQFSNQSKDRLFTQLKLALMDGKLELPRHEKLLKQLKGMNRHFTTGGSVSYSGKHDDLFWALCLAIEATQGDTEVMVEHKVNEREDVLGGRNVNQSRQVFGRMR